MSWRNKKGNKKHRSKVQKNTLHNTEILNKARNEAIKFFDDSSSMMFKAKYRATKGTGLKIKAPKTNVSKISNSSCTSKSW